MKYEDIFTFVNLIKAHRKVRRSKLHKNEVVEFELNKSHELYKLYEELNRKTYQISPYRTFYIYEPKKRRVDATPYRDRVVQNCFVDNYLFPLLENRLIYDNAACRKNKGTDFARNRLKAFLLDAYKKYGLNFYVLTFDIHHYFESINHNILKDKIRKIIKNKEILEFVLMVIDSFNKDTNVGVPLGNQTSQCFALYYLDNFDRVIKEKYRIKYYTRYMDDGVILSNDKALLTRLNSELKEVIRKLALSFNDDKNNIYPIKQGITYLGFTYRLTSTGKVVVKMSRKKKKRLIRHLNHHKLYKDSLVSYRNYLKKRSSNYRLIHKLSKTIKSNEK